MPLEYDNYIVCTWPIPRCVSLAAR